MNNHVIGFIVSALLHAGIFSGAALLSKVETNNKTSAENKVVLSVKLFKTQPVKPSPSPEPLTQTRKVIQKATHNKTNKIINNKKEELKEEKGITKIEKKSFPPKRTVVPTNTPKHLKTVNLHTRKTEKKIPKEVIKKVRKRQTTSNKKINIKTVLKKPKRKFTKKSIKKKIARKTNKHRVLRHPKKPKQKAVAKHLLKSKRVSKQIARRKPKQAIRRVAAIRTIPKKTILKAPRRSYSARPAGNSRRAAKPVRHVVRQKTSSGRSRPVSRKIIRQQPRHNTSQHTYQPPPKVPPHRVKAHHKNVVTAATAQLSKQYKARLQRLIVANRHYPKRAKRRHQQGKVTVSFRVSHSGIISDIRIIKSSNYASLDNATLQAIKRTSAKLRFFPGMSKKALHLSITINYILK